MENALQTIHGELSEDILGCQSEFSIAIAAFFNFEQNQMKNFETSRHELINCFWLFLSSIRIALLLSSVSFWSAILSRNSILIIQIHACVCVHAEVIL